MIISRSPYRVSFFGGGTDYPGWYRLHGGVVLGASIDKYCYITCRYLPPFFEHRIRVVYSKIENCRSIDEIAHPAVREALRFMKVDRGIEIHHDGDLPARSGMGSSSAFIVALLHALHALDGRMIGKHQLAGEAITLEQEHLKENVGSQDQVLSAHGGLNLVRFLTSGEVTVHPVTVSPARVAELGDHLMLFYTGIKRTSSDVAKAYVNGLDERKRQLRIMADLAEEGLSVLIGGRDITAFGDLLHEAWTVKRSLGSAISNSHVDGIYQRARENGAVGGKLLGAGGGGFMLLFAPPDRHARIREALGNLIHVPFSFESSGSQIIFFDPERDYSAEDRTRRDDQLDAFRELSELDDDNAAPKTPLSGAPAPAGR
jgi:D-glycero-alpha-D-manno-heptose-7-phosphate kinase